MLRELLFLLAALLVNSFAGLMLSKTLRHYSFEKGIHFLTTKSDETNDNPWFRVGFYVHITTSLDFMLDDRLGEINPRYARLGWNGYWKNDEWRASSPGAAASRQ